MDISFNGKEFKDVKDIIAGFITAEQEDKLKFNLIASPTLTFNVAMQLIQSMTINILSAYIKQKPEIVEDVYDAYNFMASSILNNLIPDKELRQDLDADAILTAEAQAIEKAYDALTDEEKAKAQETIDKIKEQLAATKGKDAKDAK